MGKKTTAPAEETVSGEGTAKKVGGRYADFPENLCIVGLDTPVDVNDRFYDDRVHLPLDEQDVQDVMLNLRSGGTGIIVDVTVDTHPKLKRKCVVDGRQRVRWLREVNKRLVADGHEALKINYVQKGVGDNDKLIFGMQISANEHRVDNDIVIRIRNLQRFIVLEGDEPGAPSSDTIDTAAIRFRATPSTIRNWLKCAKLVPAVLEMLRDDKITMVQALPLVKLSAEDQLAQAKELAAARAAGASSADVTERARNARDRLGGSGGGSGGASGDGEGGEPAPTSNKPQRQRPQRIVQITELALEDIAAGSGAGCDLHPEFVRALRFMAGDLAPSAVKGLTELCTRADAGERGVKRL